MARTIHLKLTGKAAEFLHDLEKEGLTERDVFAKALSILKDAHETNRVGLITRGCENSEIVEFIYGINVSKTEATKSQKPDEFTMVDAEAAWAAAKEAANRSEVSPRPRIRPGRYTIGDLQERGVIMERPAEEEET